MASSSAGALTAKISSWASPSVPSENWNAHFFPLHQAPSLRYRSSRSPAARNRTWSAPKYLDSRSPYRIPSAPMPTMVTCSIIPITFLWFLRHGLLGSARFGLRVLYHKFRRWQTGIPPLARRGLSIFSFSCYTEFVCRSSPFLSIFKENFRIPSKNCPMIQKQDKGAVPMAHPLQALRDVMAEHQIDAYLIPTADFHGSEYVGNTLPAGNTSPASPAPPAPCWSLPTGRACGPTGGTFSRQRRSSRALTSAS